jgi:4'-phosphopantetheinyl transferase
LLFRATHPPPATSGALARPCPDRRSPSRLRVVEGWRKTLAPAIERRIYPSTKASVVVWVASTASVLRAESALKLLTPCDRVAFALLPQASAGEAVAARVLLRLSLSLAFGRRKTPQEWEFAKTHLGKPFVAGLPSPISFTLAHTDTLIAVAVSTSVDVGIDVETIDQSISDDLICDSCTLAEKAHLLSLPQTQRTRQFIQLWTQKEAYSKLLGCGLSREFSSMSVPFLANDQGTDTSPKACHFEGFFIPANNSLHYASLAVANDGREPIDVRVFDVSGPDNAKRGGASLPLL